jgi:ornithine lipid ester-linked acyl 2-hydroxylase
MWLNDSVMREHEVISNHELSFSLSGMTTPTVKGVAPAPPQHFRRPFPLQELMEGAHRALNAYNRAVAHLSPHGRLAVFDPASFPWVSGVEREWRAIRAELDEVLQRPDDIPQFSDISPDQVHLTQYGKWKTFFFFAYGARVEENCRRCPETSRILRTIPGVQTAFFSILEPHMHIAPHCGPYGGVLRYHLALRVPRPPGACRIRVADRTLSWEEGKSLVFDDTYEHEAWNDADAQRVVLFVDFERPLPRGLRQVNRRMIRLIGASPFVRDAIARYEAWSAARAKVTGRG